MQKTEVVTGKLLNEGKTKKIFAVENMPGHVVMVGKDDITAGDGRMHDVILGKADIATTTTANVFRFLRECGLPVAFVEQLSPTRILAKNCEMIPIEVVVRREAHGSCLKRYPTLKKGHLFPQLVFETFLKTSGKQWKGTVIPKDDPLMIYGEGGRASLYLPDQPIWAQQPFLVLDEPPLGGDIIKRAEIEEITRKTFLALERAWQILGRRLVDFKIEFGVDQEGKLLIADVIDNDSWRVLENGVYIDKQFYREGGDLNEVTAKYRHVQALTSRFEIPRQQIVLWRGSEKDDLEVYEQALMTTNFFEAKGFLAEITCSMHKEPASALEQLSEVTHGIPDTVVIAAIGMSNGAGPTLSAQTTAPVITVPATVKDFPDDIWSSLRVPSKVPVMTVLSPQNAVLAAFQILAQRNPRLYADLRYEQEKRLVNVVPF